MPSLHSFVSLVAVITCLSACTAESTVFRLGVEDQAAARDLIADSTVYAAGAEVTAATVGGRAALRLETTEEFSDLFIDVRRLAGRPVDLRSGYLSFDLFVPRGSDIASVKVNQRGADGSFGGCGHYFNNLSGNRGRWLSVVVPLAEQQQFCQGWTGEGDYREEVVALSINPHNASRVDTGILYVNNIALSSHRPAGQPTEPRLAERPYVAVNSPYTITFEDTALLARQLAYRTFESTTQYLATDVYGNPGRAIRAYGTGANRYICWLPDIEEMTGHPVDFRALDSIHFRYYLTEESDRVDGARLFITTGEDWEGILIAENFLPAEALRRGQWTRYAAAIADLETTAAREPRDVLSAVYEMRLDLKYDSTAGPIEFWVDDFGWK